MNRLPYSHVMPRVADDIRDCVRFIALQPRGNPGDRMQDILAGMSKLRRNPEGSRVEALRAGTGLKLRRYRAAQFAIIYAYIEPTEATPQGVVSIRAVRHQRVRNVFFGVREPPAVATDDFNSFL